METERQILEKLIADGKEAERKLKELEVMYSMGDRFMADGQKTLLAGIGNGKAVMIGLMDGCFHKLPRPVNDVYAITGGELRSLCGCGPVRYWDSRKKVKT